MRHKGAHTQGKKENRDLRDEEDTMQITAETTAWDRLVNALTYGSFTLPVSTGFWWQCTRLDSIYAQYS